MDDCKLLSGYLYLLKSYLISVACLQLLLASISLL